MDRNVVVNEQLRVSPPQSLCLRAAVFQFPALSALSTAPDCPEAVRRLLYASDVLDAVPLVSALSHWASRA
jgi:hypothetical protein